ncbi:MAG: ATP-binding protein [Faecalimonas sp.]|nr:ATP-binding protein [Faecalimonas sp.]
MALNNSQYDTILRSYEQRQLQNRYVLEERRRELYARIPELKEIHDTISALSVSQARKLLEGDSSALEALRTETSQLLSKKVALLASAGFPADYLDAVYTCVDCKDTGYIGNQKCHCFRKAAVDLLYAQSNLRHILTKENFDTFSFDYYSDNYIDPLTGQSSLATMQAAYRKAQNFVDSFSTDFQNLFLYGDTGVGKTFLSNCIAKALMDKTFSVVYFTAQTFFDTLAKGKFEKDDTAELMAEHFLDCDLLIIDDLGTESPNSFTVAQFFFYLNERILREKSTIISTNLSLEALVEIYSERTFSRITSNYTMLKLTGDDIRIKKKLMNREDM